jgi:flagellar motor switch protein FliN/FliY
MSQNVDYEPLTPAGGPLEPAGDLRRLSAVPVDLSVEIGRTRMTVGEALELREGSVVTLDRLAGEPVDLLVNGTPIARGEVVVIDEQFGLRLTEVISGQAAQGEPPALVTVPVTGAIGDDEPIDGTIDATIAG